ncbi:MAG TPA: benzoyl-CoA reductase subunit A [Planctomycetes bacterium]|nr:benzoyl-CoA reductase subunit A [Planctomycetota bacterium]
MKYCVGIDLGSTTTKAVVLNEEGKVMGRGITNSRSNYEVACEVAVAEALINARFGLIEGKLQERGVDEKTRREQLEELEQGFRLAQYLDQCNILREEMEPLTAVAGEPFPEAVGGILTGMEKEASELFGKGSRRKSDFFRDLAGSRYLAMAEQVAKDMELSYDQLVGLFDKAILRVENHPSDADAFGRCIRAALSATHFDSEVFRESVEEAGSLELEQVGSVGTGYGRQTLPFPKEDIRSEILCHGLGAHAMFPGTRTVLDIGGQDTKAIQVDPQGIVTSFQMNDRCAAGCGRYLGYIADEMNLGLHELGPLACKSKRSVKINSTCTVFAGAELRERLSLGEKREDILSGLHRAIILRAMSLLARSGGVENEFTFTGGVAKNEAAVGALKKLIFENYGEVTLNISPDSIYTGALGAAIFSHREWMRSDEEEKVSA